jgi:hypothetical protein
MRLPVSIKRVAMIVERTSASSVFRAASEDLARDLQGA